MGGDAVVLDLGQGSFSELGLHRRPESINGVLISHLHADHLVDLVPLRHFLIYEAGSDGAVELHGPRELRSRFDAFQGERDFLRVMPGDPLEPGSFELAAFVIEARHVTHIPDSFAFRISAATGDAPGLVYSGDCSEPADLVPLLRPGDTLLCEAAFGTAEPGAGIHLTAGQAAEAAATGEAARLVLTHILDRHDEQASRQAAARVFGGEVLVAAPGLTLTVGGE